MKKVLNVYWGKGLVGNITKENANFTFQYSKEWIDGKNAFPISVSLPLKESLFERDISEAFFGNLLPESGIRTKIARYYGFSEKNNFAMLNAIGGECAGALMIVPENESVCAEDGYSEVDVMEISQMISAHKKRPLIIGKDGLRLSLAGAQDKLPVYAKDNKYYIPRGIAASNFIIKPPIDEFQDTVINEAFCMKLAKNTGLEVVDVEIVRKGAVFLLVKRYDRLEQHGKVVRMHQEDFCQAIGIPYDHKYETEGGPGLADCFNLIDTHSSQPALDKKRLIEFIVFNYYTGNADAHGKNISFLYEKGRIRLAPFYDLMSTLVYDGLTDKMAMKIDGENRLRWIRKRHFERFASKIDVKPKMVIDILEQMGRKLMIEGECLIKEFDEKGFDPGIIKSILSVIKKQKENWISIN